MEKRDRVTRMMLTTTPLYLVVALLVVFPETVGASPFCVSIQGIPSQCIYADGRQCQIRAQQLGGVCSANPAEVKGTPGPGQFCLVVQNSASICAYPDRTSCEVEAARKHTACIEAPGPLPDRSADPFAIRRPY